MNGTVVKLDDHGTWQCRHVADSGEPAPSTRLRLDRTLELHPGAATSARRRWINCPDCGTYWRVWVHLRVAKPSIDWNALASFPSFRRFRRFRRAPIFDIDRVIDRVKVELGEVSVVQHHGAWPPDDEGVWDFRLPNVEYTIQLESSAGMCPFIVEHDRMPSPAGGGGWTATSVEEAARMVVDYLREEAAARGSKGAG